MGNPKRHLIVTCSDAQCGEFVIEHWLRSLRENVSLVDVDVVVIDYGLTDAQRKRLHDQHVQTMPSSLDGHIVNIRYRDIARYLKKHSYDQVMAVDGGDVIFQSDVRSLFNEHKEAFRGVCEHRNVPLSELLMPMTDMARDDYRRIFDFLRGKKQINGGVILGPAQKFLEFWKELDSLCKNFEVYGTDQLVINYLFYRDGFRELESKYNFVIVTTRSPFTIKNGQFFDETEELIPIVHNAGMKSITRCIKNFGYGPQYNCRKRVSPVLLHFLLATMNLGMRFVRILSPRVS